MKNLKKKEFIYKDQKKTLSTFKIYEKRLLIVEARLTDLMMYHNLLSIQESATILNR